LETPIISPSPAEVNPVLNVADPPFGESFKIILITPAIASEPYCADAPSLKTCMSLIASMEFLKYQAVSPRPGEVCVYNKALKFLRLPFVKLTFLVPCF
jgi:hypothetical protein